MNPSAESNNRRIRDLMLQYVKKKLHINKPMN